MKKLIPILTILISTVTFSQSHDTAGSVTHQHVSVGVGGNALGVNIKIPYGGTAGWARGYSISNADSSERFVQFGAFGGGQNNFVRAYIGRNFSDTFMSFLPNGNVGIGTNTPSTELDVNGNIAFKNAIISTNGLWDAISNVHTRISYNASNTTGNFHIYNGNIAGGNEVFTINSSSNVGIGTLNPDEKLTVNGKILCEEVEVIQDVAPDYVFQKYYTGASVLKADYTMPTLEEVEAFTKANHHLPEVPSAAEQKEDGMQLKEMTNLLLQKVEELTLYTIEQEKRIDTLEAKLAEKE